MAKPTTTGTLFDTPETPSPVLIAPVAMARRSRTASPVERESLASPTGGYPSRALAPPAAPAVVEDPPPPKVNEIEQRAIDLGARCAAFRVTDDATYLTAGEQLVEGERQLKAWIDLQEDAVRTAHLAHVAACATREKIAKPMREGLAALRTEWARHYTARTLEIKTAAVADVQHTIAVQQATQVGAIERQFDEAVDRGDDAKAHRLLAAVPTFGTLRPALPAPPPPAVKPLPKAAGINPIIQYTYDIVCEDDIPRKYMTPDRKMISAVVEAMKEKTDIAGISVRPDTAVRVLTKAPKARP